MSRIAGCRGRTLDAGSQSKIEHFDQAAGRDHNVARFHIPMDHAFFVRGFQGFRDLPCDVQRFRNGNCVSLNGSGERFAGY